jgi:glutamate-1-semialdehyde 2,1-aminomutase
MKRCCHTKKRLHNAALALTVEAEPLQRCTPPEPGFLEGVRRACSESGVLLIFDEVVAAKRHGRITRKLGGIQRFMSVVGHRVLPNTDSH